LDEPSRFALGIALLRLTSLPEEIPETQHDLVQRAGDAAALLVESKYDLAFSRFEQLLKEYPRTPYLHYAYGSALMSASLYDRAEQQLSVETEISPQSALPYRRRAAIALQLRQPQAALPIAQRALQLDSNSAEGHYLLGRSWLELGKPGESVQELEAARDLVPNSPEVRFTLARAYAKAGQAAAAARERAAFERLNAAAQQQKSRSGSQAYGALQNQNNLHAVEGEVQPAAVPQ
jgi:predicted Zn-dependent protease